ncbi:SpoU rRNA Methylase family protein [Enhydrobacter aerosaccus]|uniref:SpoU rRNA Methylase family protein n=1 Tax=Enhydrobacter aerosaccus TaxID=225324 RepID=A0A1T4QAG8_9HYPH|nr:RNA methyltransferase [Enhydrobacter aerosaccus]SKA00616.1 SpoU rRNA Methylase family protein [Enhydrobacter aerosaccus]
MKGYFGIGVEGVSKAMNVGTLFRTAHAFGASFVFTLRAQYNRREGGHSDTSDTPRSVPTYHFADLSTFRLPAGCRLVGIEISDEAIELPSFRHPRQAAYILGSEREGLSTDVQSLCDYVVKIPTRFSVNLGVAGALVMYDRLLTLGRHAPRPVGEGGPTETAPVPVFGEPLYKRRQRLRQKAQAKQ